MCMRRGSVFARVALDLTNAHHCGVARAIEAKMEDGKKQICEVSSGGGRELRFLFREIE
jgi:hypothetical protein